MARLWRWFLRVFFNLGGLVLAIVAVWIGALALSPEAGNGRASDSGVILATPVRLMTLEIQDEISVERQFLGRLEARRTAELSFEHDGRIESIPVREGQRVREGDVLALLALDALVVERRGLEANLGVARTRFERADAEARRLDGLMTRGVIRRDIAVQAKLERDALEASVVSLESQLAQLELRFQGAELYAPFDGIIGEIRANFGETVGAGQSVVTIFESGGADFRVGLPSSIDPQALQAPRLTVNGQSYGATLTAIRPDISSAGNTRTAIFTVDSDALVDFGMPATLSADVTLPLRGAWVPVDAIRPSAEGYWIVLAVNEEMIAERIAVEVEYLRDDLSYVIGAFDPGTRIIRAGAHKVVPGQPVREE